MKGRSALRPLALFVSLAAMYGCATSMNDHYNTVWEKIDSEPKAALSQISESKDWYESQKMELAYFYDLGLVALRSGDLKTAAKHLKEADKISSGYFKSDFSGTVQAFTVAEDASDYIGDAYELVHLAILRSVIAASLGDFETARALAKNSNQISQNYIAKLSRAHGFNVAKGSESSAAKDVRWHYTKDALAYYIGGAAAYNMGDLENALVNLRNSLKVYQSKVYSENFLVPEPPSQVVSLYCSVAKEVDGGKIRSVDAGLVERSCANVEPRDGSVGEAVVFVLKGRAATKQSLNVDVKMDESSISTAVGSIVSVIADSMKGEESAEGKTAEKDASAGPSSLVYKALLGAIAANQQIHDQIAVQVAELEKSGSKELGSQVYAAAGALDPNSLRLSVPVLLWYPNPASSPSIQVNSETLKVSLAQNLDGIREREMFDKMPLAMTRSVSRSLVRLATQKAVEQVGGGLAAMAAGAAAKGAESSEVRSIRTLPQSIYLASAQSDSPKIALKSDNTLLFPKEVNVEPKKVSFALGITN